MGFDFALLGVLGEELGVLPVVLGEGGWLVVVLEVGRKRRGDCVEVGIGMGVLGRRGGSVG